MRNVLATIMVFVLFFILAPGGESTASAADSVKIGLLAPYIGVFSKYGNSMKNGFKLALDEAEYKTAGREILLIDEDTEGKPDVGLTKAKKLIEKDHVHVLAGIVSSAVAYAVKDLVTEKKIPLVITNAGATKLTQEQRTPYIFRSSFANGQYEKPGAWYAYAKMGARKAVVMVADFSGGHEKADPFMTVFKLMGGEVVEKIYPPLGTNDYGPYMAKVVNLVGKIDLVWASFFAADGVRFVNQYSEYGLKEKVKLLGDVTDEDSLPSQKDAALGVLRHMPYVSTLDTPENNRFRKEYLRKYNEEPNILAESSYNGSKAIVRALDAVGGKIENRDAFLKALRSVKFEAPRGPFRFDQHQNVITNVYIQRAEKRDGKYLNFVIDTIPDVDQYWMPKK